MEGTRDRERIWSRGEGQVLASQGSVLCQLFVL